MSKQYLTTHTIDHAHPTDIFSLAATPTELITASGTSTIKIYSTLTNPPSLTQELTGAHAIGCHHISASTSGTVFASAGFDGSLKIWEKPTGTSTWSLFASLSKEHGVKPGEVWAIALTEEGSHLTATTVDGRVNVWDVQSKECKKVFELSTGMGNKVKGSFGLCVDVSRDGKWTAVGCENGGVYVFDNDTKRLAHSLPGLVKPVRTLRFSPLSSRLAAAGDSKTIALYDVKQGEQIANLTGSSSWIFSVDWSDTGEYILSGSFDGKAKVWSVEQRQCVATHSESEGALWSVKWLPKTGRSEAFVAAGAGGGISFYREATGG